VKTTSKNIGCVMVLCGCCQTGFIHFKLLFSDRYDKLALKSWSLHDGYDVITDVTATNAAISNYATISDGTISTDHTKPNTSNGMLN
jgi:hypothetical protein